MSRTRTRKWLLLATAGYASILLAILIGSFSTLANPFQGLLSPASLGSVVVTVLAGSIAMLSAAAALPHRKTWRTFVFIGWGFVAMTSPLFGLFSPLPWVVLLLTAPIICGILIHWFRPTQ